MGYIDAAIRTEAPITEETLARAKNALRILHAIMGLTGEAGELIDELKKHIFYGKDLDTVNLVEEHGDFFWYMALLAHELGITFEDSMQRNEAKLRARYPQHFTSDRALNRDLQTERTILENKSPAPAIVDASTHSAPVETIVEASQAVEIDYRAVRDVSKGVALIDCKTGAPIEPGKYVVLRLDNGGNSKRGYAARMAARLYKKLIYDIPGTHELCDRIEQAVIAEDEKEPALNRSKNTDVPRATSL